MKKVLTSIVMAAMLTIGGANANPLEDGAFNTETLVADNVANGTDNLLAEETEDSGEENGSGTGESGESTPGSETAGEDNPATGQDVDEIQSLKEKFIEGGPLFMGVVLIVLILGLALCIERIVYLNMATTNNEKLLEEIEAALKSGGVEAAKEVCRNTKGPVASIFYQGLDRSSEGIEVAEKSVIGYGGVQMGLLEKGLPWISLFIALAPMLGFMGTVIGMIQAFDTIEGSAEIKVSEVAGGIKVALLTTVFGLIVAIILQIFYNYIVSKIDSLTNQMEDASITLIDILVKHKG